MITVRLMGGLGNQMFQYACGRRLAIARGVPLVLDTQWLEARELKAHEHYALGSFELCSHVRRFGRRPSWPARAFTTVIKERSFALDRRVLNAPGRTYLDGFWQNEGYFSDVAPRIRSEFALRIAPTAEAVALAAKVGNGHTVSLHVRRADYPDALPGAYYRETVAEMRQRVSDPKFYVFSDDLEWARQELRLPAATTFVDFLPAGQPWVDMFTMSKCRHHIIANSTFSWWGAWLAPRIDSVVLAPRVWFFSDHPKDADFQLPSSWIRL
ncbi:MAG TPA: alpha-1,2-fucosyltransferase [Acidimicrobiales bacterium]|nr:alpha-1,2-fucosyltransferase [Acidimicrobiales bacterium]